jgi:hypothetical protein
MTCHVRHAVAPNRNEHGVYQSSYVNRVWSPFGGLKKSGYGHELSEPS